MGGGVTAVGRDVRDGVEQGGPGDTDAVEPDLEKEREREGVGGGGQEGGGERAAAVARASVGFLSISPFSLPRYLPVVDAVQARLRAFV